MNYKKANIKICMPCYFSIYTYNEKRNEFKFMCGFKRVWYNIPAIMFKNVWLEKRGKA